MLTPSQEKWLNHLSDDKKIKIVPFDPTCDEKFEKIKATIQTKLGKDTKIQHHGASSLKISGQDEIDIYIPVSPKVYDNFIEPLKQLFGEPKSHYPLERTRFRTSVDGKQIDIFLINEESVGWLDGLKFENYLKTHPESLDEYRKLKESGNGLSVREYYLKKIEFINDILSKVK